MWPYPVVGVCFHRVSKICIATNRPYITVVILGDNFCLPKPGDIVKNAMKSISFVPKLFQAPSGASRSAVEDWHRSKRCIFISFVGLMAHTWSARRFEGLHLRTHLQGLRKLCVCVCVWGGGRIHNSRAPSKWQL